MRMLSIIVCAFLCALPLSAAWLLWYLFSIDGRIAQCEKAADEYIVIYEQTNGRQAPDRIRQLKDLCTVQILNQELGL